MDKIFILILFLLTFVAIYQYSAPTYLGTFWGGCLYEIPNTYKFTEAAGCEYSLKEIDITVVTVFSIVNFLYYFLFESTLKASLGKYICGGIACTEDEKTISVKDVFLRSLVLILFIVVAVTIRFSILQVSYIFLILLFFCVLDLPILFKKKSLVDIATNTFYVSRKSLKEDKITSPEDKQTLVIKKNNSKVNTLFCILGFLIVGIIYSSYRFSKELNLLHNMNSFIKVNNNSFKNYEREQLSVLKGTGYFTDSLEHKTLDELNALGPVPYGKVISTIGGTELGTYSYNVPISEYNDKPDWYWGLYSETRYKDFEYKYSLTTIDISKFYTDSNDTEITTDEIYKELKRNLGSFENKEFSLSDYSAHIRWSLYYDSIPKNTHSISYWTCDEKRIPVIRSIILANKRAYVLEVETNAFMVYATCFSLPYIVKILIKRIKILISKNYGTLTVSENEN